MKTFFYFLIAIIGLSINTNAQKRVVEDAMKVAVIVPAIGYSGCTTDTKPCAVTNKATNRSITVKVEEWFLVNKKLYSKTMVLDKITPGEIRYLGCVGHTEEGLEDKSIGYKILLAYYEPDNKGATASK